METFKTQLQIGSLMTEEDILVFPTNPAPVVLNYCQKEGHISKWVRSSGDVYCENCYLENVIHL